MKHLRWILPGALCFFFLLAPGQASASIAVSESQWFHVDAQGEVHVDFYFFWSDTCPHCRKAKPFIGKLPDAYPWLSLHSYNINEQGQENARRFTEMLVDAGERSFAVPAFFYCGKIHYGYGSDETTGEYLRKEILSCRENILIDLGGKEKTPAPQSGQPKIALPFFGEIDPATVSLPVFTLIIAAVDAFNPCAFFILLFLLSLLVHAQSRARMLLVGGIFLFFSGLIYFIFMAAWLNLFMMMGEIKAVTLIAGIFAAAVSAINIKDYFLFKRGISLSIPDGAKPKLYQRVVGLINVDNLPSLIVGTIFLALAANAYELLCTAGFPMVFTRILTLNELPPPTYYLYLIFYNVVYVIPLLIIVLTFTFTLGSRKLTEEEGRILKLLSGLMMLGLGGLLIFAPVLLNNLLTAVSLLAFSIGLTVLIVWVDRAKSRRCRK